MIFPWQLKQWKIIAHAIQADRLPHALLFNGLAGLGKAHFANCVANAILCEQCTVDGLPCTKCHACQLVAGRVHPNILWVEPDKNSLIKVDQIRDITDFLQLTAFNGTARFVIIHSATSMNLNAANALLKILEEPTAGGHLILLTENERMPVTVKSRCQRIKFSTPPLNTGLQWLSNHLPKNTVYAPEILLRLTHGAPLRALELATDDEELMNERQAYMQALAEVSTHQADPIHCAKQFINTDVLRLMDMTNTWLIDLFKLHFQAEDSVFNHDQIYKLRLLAQTMNKEKSLKLINHIQGLRNHFYCGLNLNKQLMIEQMMIQLTECISC